MIVVVGSINLDLIARVSRLPLPGETVSGSSYVTAPGGKGANQALAARRAGAEVKILGAVGGDNNGHQATHILAEAGVDLTSLSVHKDNTPTGVALILVDEISGENQIAVVAGANGSLKPEIINSLKIQNEDFILLQMEIPKVVNLATIEAAKKSGATSMLNIAPYNFAAVELAKSADVVTANESEFDALAKDMGLTGVDRENCAKAFVAMTGKTIVITLGADGAIGACREGLYKTSAPSINPVDTVGAGDTFCGALAVALSEGQDLVRAMKFGCAAGAIACLKNGAQPAIPDRAQIEAMLQTF